MTDHPSRSLPSRSTWHHSSEDVEMGMAGGPFSMASTKQSRRKHTKSRNGCSVCKRRKIKCDETRPSCRNCIKHSIICDFLPSTESPSTGVSSEPSLNLTDLELLHNFTSSTFATLSNNPTVRDIWRSAVVRKAVHCDFVMRALLAVSAIHISQHRPEQKYFYISYAVAHHEVASRVAVKRMAELNPENHEDLWIFSVLTMYFTLGSPKDHYPSLVTGENALPDWIHLFNGVHHLLSELTHASYSGILSPIIRAGGERWIATHRPENENTKILHELSAKVNASVTDEEERSIYDKAICELEAQLSGVLPIERVSLDIMDAFVWQFAVADTFVPLLQQMKQEAIAIFAYSLVIFSAVSGNRWLQGWDTFLLSRVWNILDEEHRLWIQWPIEQIGWVPPE